MLASFLRCHSTTETLNLTVEAFRRGGCGEREARGGEMLPTLAVGWRASALRGEEAGCFREVDGVPIVAAGGPRSQ